MANVLVIVVDDSDGPFFPAAASSVVSAAGSCHNSCEGASQLSLGDLQLCVENKNFKINSRNDPTQ